MSQYRNHYLQICLLNSDILTLQIFNINNHLEIIIINILIHIHIYTQLVEFNDKS